MPNKILARELFALESEWHMTSAERCTLIYVLQQVRPDVSIEIGTFKGGSLRPISRYSRKVYSFDINPNQHQVGALFPNVEFITGDTRDTLSKTIDDLNRWDHDLGFILVDGSHEADGVRCDLINCLRYIPKRRPTVILMHDSSNPSVREGIRTTDWSANPHVHTLDLDFVPGILYDRPDISGQLWGGLALALLLPEPRTDDIKISSSFQHSYETLLQHSVHVLNERTGS